MAIRSASLLMLLPPLLLLCTPAVSIPAFVAAQAGDEATLLAFKAAVNGGAHNDSLLPSWNSSSVGGDLCTWEGVRCGARHRRVVALSLPSRGLTGTLSPAIGNLTFLRELNLSSNWLHGDIPATIARLVRLRMLDLSYNTLDGGLPANLSFGVSLSYLDLSSNRLHGRVPVELGNRLTSLQSLSLANNSLTGQIPASLANMSSLNFLNLGENQLEGSIPPEIGSIGGLNALYLYANNLSEDMSVRVGDFGISKILLESATDILQYPNSTTGIRGTIGYVAPEYGEGSSASTQGDVYSLGILLLEMFTGKSPTDEMFNDSLDLHKFSQNALPERIWEIVDPIIWIHTDAYNGSARNGILNCLVSVITLGISCSKKQPRDRIPIQDATIEMHGIRDSYLKYARSHLVGTMPAGSY